ncbi:MAG: PKD domain-containing protein [Saprospiraceae bacterium]|nr:PKD domain-containing protein [Saprospiraceae bacterium]
MSTFVSFEWDFGDPSSGTANTSTHATPTHIYTQNSTYNVCVDVIDNNGCCADRRCTSVTITDLPNFNIQSIASSPCNYEFQAVGIQNNQTGVTYSWNFGDGTPTGSGKFVNHTYTSSGTYTVSCTVTNICGSSTQSVIVVVNVTTINAEFSVQNNCPFYTFTVTNPVSNVTYTWDFGDNTANVTGNQVSHNYSFNGTKVVTLTATKNCGYGSMTQNVEVNCNAASCTDDPNVIVIGQTDQTTYISALFNNGTIPFTLTGQIRKISNLNFNLKGNLIIDRNVKFVECNWIMESGAQIVLNNTLDLDKTN